MPGMLLSPGCCCEPPEEVDSTCCTCFYVTNGVNEAGTLNDPIVAPVAPGGLGLGDITITLDAPLFGSETYILHNAGGGCDFIGDCVHVADGPGAGYYRFSFNRALDGNGLTLTWSSDSGCVGADLGTWGFYPDDPPAINPLNVTIPASPYWTVNPFGPAPPTQAAGVTTLTLTQTSPRQKCYWRPLVQNCLGEPVEGATVEIRSPGGVVASGVTDATGHPPPLEYTDYEMAADLTWKITGTGVPDTTAPFRCVIETNLVIGAGDCCQRFRVLGCLSAGVEGARVAIQPTGGGAEIIAGETDAAGEVVLGWDGDCSVRVVITHPSGRWADYAEDWELSSGQETELFPAAADGYHCSGFCNEPLADDLQAIDLNGTWPATYDGAHADGAGWYACAVRTGMANVVTDLNDGVCTKVVGTGDVPYVIRLPATGTTIAEYYGQYAAPGQEQTAATPTCSAGVLDLDATIPASCVGGSITRAEATATGNPDSCPESLVITATMPGTGSNSTVNPGSGGITFTE